MAYTTALGVKSGPGIVEEVLGDIGVPLLRLKAQDEYQAEDLAKQINLTLKESRQKKPVTDESPEQETATTIVNEVLSVAAKSTVTFWTNAVSKFRGRFFQVSKGTLK